MRYIYKNTYTETILFAGFLKQKKGIYGWTDDAIFAALTKWLPTRCIVSGNQPIYDALVAHANDSATQDKSGFYHAAKFVRSLNACLFVQDHYTIERIFSGVKNEDVISEEAADFIDAFISARDRKGY
jgi:hypothetical protein